MKTKNTNNCLVKLSRSRLIDFIILLAACVGLIAESKGSRDIGDRKKVSDALQFTTDSETQVKIAGRFSGDQKHNFILLDVKEIIEANAPSLEKICLFRCILK